ncbi:sortase [Candidatus Gottesmanbacteria bacterium]|nr:sortase [Candidatus Gottesmanbacteria bacterium]
MALYSYVKQKPQRFRRAFSLVSTFFVFTGLSLIGWVAYPIIAFELFYAPRFIGIIKPIPEKIISEALENRILAAQNSEVFAAEAGVDYTKASNWFPKASPQRIESEIVSYSISIPKLKIENAEVRVGSEDLNKSIIHWAGSAMPGEYGTSVLFGHSTIVWLYDPKNYHTIFSKLPDLNRGDDIYYSVNNVAYRYQVEEMRVTSPDDLSVLEQKYDDSYTTLVTCVPAGTYLKRLVVTARLVKF